MALSSTNDANLTQMAYERLRADLLSCELEPDGKLNISALAQSLAVSQGAVREALSRLISEGLVVLEQNRGFRATPVAADLVKNLSAARLEIDELCLRSAIKHGGLEWEAGLLAASHRLSRTLASLEHTAPALSELTNVHRRFYESLFSACDNSWLTWMQGLLYNQSSRYRYACLGSGHEKTDFYDYDGPFVSRVLVRDAEGALVVMKTHYELNAQRIVDALAARRLEAPAPRGRGARRTR